MISFTRNQMPKTQNFHQRLLLTYENLYISILLKHNPLYVYIFVCMSELIEETGPFRNLIFGIQE